MGRLVGVIAGAVAVGLVIGGVSLASGGPANRNNPLVLNLVPAFGQNTEQKSGVEVRIFDQQHPQESGHAKSFSGEI